MQAQWEMRVMAQKLQSMTDTPVPSGDVGTQLDNCRDDSAQLRWATFICILIQFRRMLDRLSRPT